MANTRSTDEIYEQLDKAADHDRKLWSGMSYEDGVDAALRWVLGDSDTGPMDEEG